MKAKDFKEKKVYSEASGVCALVDENIKMCLNEFGNYEEIVVDEEIELKEEVRFVSPNLNEHENETKIAEKLFGRIKNIEYDKRIGYYKSLYAGYVSEGQFREEGSSGGMGTWILKELFEKNMIDGVIHVKKAKKNNEVLFHYDISRSMNEIIDGSKTKYYPVELSEVIKRVRELPGRYAIVGIPSFIMAIRLLSEKDRLIKDRILYTIGLVCGHQKSSKFAESIAWQVGIRPGNLRDINFRKKLLDKPANNYGVEITGLIDGKEITIVKQTKDFVGQDWGQGCFKTKASDFTDDVMNETADITLGDAWLPEYTQDSKGNNIIVVRNQELDNLIKEGINGRKLSLDIVDKETIFRSQAAHYRHTHDELAYRLYKKDKNKEWRPEKRVKASKKISYLRRNIQDLREEISEKSHIIYKEAVEKDDLNYFILEMGKLSKKYYKLYRLLAIQKKGILGTIKAIIKKCSKIKSC